MSRLISRHRSRSGLLRPMGLNACCVADQPLDRFGRGDIYLVVPPDQWSQANENLAD